MGMPAARVPQRRWTLDEFYAARDAAPFGERWEFVDGEVLVTHSPHWTHQGVNLEPSLVLQPDVLVVPKGELRVRSDRVRHLLLAVEVVSPSSAKHDRVTKRPRYQRNRVPEYWVIDDQSQTVERWRPDDERPELIADVLRWHPDGASEPFALDLPGFFAEAGPGD